MLVLIGLTFYLPFSAMVVVGQQYLPNRVGLSSGVTLGLSVSIGGLVAPLLGKLADLHGLHAALTVVALLPILALGVVATLPKVQALPPAEEPRAGMPPPPYAPAEAE
jgi:FSR family fosmidomycin resistance protein-like MFS transporter